MANEFIIAPERLHEFVVSLFGKLGVPSGDAGMVADNLIDADLRGVTTHGVTRIPSYIEKFEQKLCFADNKPEIIKDFGATAQIDAHHTLGQVSSTMAMKLAIKKAEQFGIGYVGVKDSSHNGTAGYYAMMALEHDMIGWSITNASTKVVPFGGIERRLGTNPIAYAIPAKRHLPVLLDMATSKVAQGKLMVAGKKNVPIPDDWALDINGNPTTDTEEALKGLLLPLGYKGYGLAVVVDMLSGVLNSTGFGSVVNTATDYPQIGHAFMAIKIEAFADADEFKNNVDALIDEITTVKLAKGTEKVYMPGEIEFDIKTENLKKGGVPLQPFQIAELSAAAEKYGLNPSEYFL